MSTIRFFQPGEAGFQRTADFVPAGGSIGEAERQGTEVRFHHPGAEGEPQLFEVRCAPDLDLPTHAHSKDEIIVVIEGELHFGERVCGPGSSVLIKGDTLYGFRTGSEGCRFLNFRAERDPVYTSRDEYLARRAGV